MTPLLPADLEFMRSTERMILAAFSEAAFVSAKMSPDRHMTILVGVPPRSSQGTKIRISTYIQQRMPCPTNVEFLQGSSRNEINEGSQQAQVS